MCNICFMHIFRCIQVCFALGRFFRQNMIFKGRFAFNQILLELESFRCTAICLHLWHVPSFINYMNSAHYSIKIPMHIQPKSANTTNNATICMALARALWCGFVSKEMSNWNSRSCANSHALRHNHRAPAFCAQAAHSWGFGGRALGCGRTFRDSHSAPSRDILRANSALHSHGGAW